MVKHTYVMLCPCECSYGVVIRLVKDKHSDLSSSDYVLTVSSVKSKVFELLFVA